MNRQQAEKRGAAAPRRPPAATCGRTAGEPLARRARVRWGEVDIVAPAGGWIALVEVAVHAAPQA